MIKKFFISALILFLTNCSTPNWYKPMGYTLFSQMPKGGTPGFKLGWIHGCESGLGSQFAGAFYMTFYTWKRDPDITSVDPNIKKIRIRYKKELRGINWDNPEEIKKNFSDYNTIFWGAHAFCRHSALGVLQTADMAPPLPGEERYDMMKHSVGNVFKITARDSRIGSNGSMW
ncbi:MAG: hypothetical protein SFV53_02885 [Rickettsiales bacterium]|nr:hypothetical protein [Rickettsiales bacterium]